MRNIQNDQQAIAIALSYAQERAPIQKIRNVLFEDRYDGILVDYADEPAYALRRVKTTSTSGITCQLLLTCVSLVPQILTVRNEI